MIDIYFWMLTFRYYLHQRGWPGEQVCDLELNSGQLHLWLDLAVRVIDDGEEHVEEDEEDNEDVEDEEDRADDRVGCLEGTYFLHFVIFHCISLHF